MHYLACAEDQNALTKPACFVESPSDLKSVGRATKILARWSLAATLALLLPLMLVACGSSSTSTHDLATGSDAGPFPDGGSNAKNDLATDTDAGPPSDGGCDAKTAPVTETLPQGKTLFENNYGFYPRVIRLEHSGALDGTLVATVVRQNAAGHWIGHLAQSTDGGLTFTALGDVDDPAAAGGMCCQTLFELPIAIGAMPAGTLLWAASFGADVQPTANRRMSERVWQSQDHGKTWTFLSTVTTTTTSQGTWEPEFTVAADGHLVIFYSDETDPAHSQKLVAWRTTDGVTWTDYRSVVADDAYASRPGMAVVRKTPDGNWLMSYEVCATDSSHICEAHVRSSPDGWNWGDPANLGERVLLADGEFPASTPTLSVAGKTVLLKAMRQRNANLTFAAGDGKSIFANVNNGHGPWFEIPAPVTMNDPGQTNNAPGYSNPLLGSADGKAVFFLATDYGADGVYHGYYASGLVAPTGDASALEGSQAFVMGTKLHVFARTASGDLRHWSKDGSNAAVAETWGSGLDGEPATIVYVNQLHAFARSTMGALRHFYEDATAGALATDTWATGLASDPAALVIGDAQHAWAVDTAGALQHWWWSPGQGGQHDTWGQNVLGRPSAILAGGAQHVFVRSTAGALEHWWWNAAQGMQHETIGGAAPGTCGAMPALASAPVAADLGGAEHVWGVDTGGQLQHYWWNPGQPWKWETWGQGLVGRPSYLQAGDAQHVFAHSTSGAVEHWWWNPLQGLQHDTWSGSVVVASDATALSNGAEQDAFALDASGNLHRWYWTAATGIVHDSWGQ